MTPSLSVLVVCYNCWELAIRALTQALSLEGNAIAEYILFDNGSTLTRPEVIDPRIKVVRGVEVNQGFAHGLVTAFAGIHSDIVILFDSDAYPITPFSRIVRERFQAEARLGQLAFLAEDENGSRTESFVREPTQWSLILGQALDHRLKKQAEASNICVSTACMATRKQAYSQSGGFDERLEFLDVDIDYSMNLRRHGWGIAVEPRLRAFHVGGGSTITQRNRVFQHYKSRWYLLRKYELIRKVSLVRSIVLARLKVESFVLRSFGRFLFRNPDVLADKILGRRSLLEYCSTNYN